MAASLLSLPLLPVMGFAYHVFFDRSGLPDIEPFIRFKPPTIGEVYGARSTLVRGYFLRSLTSREGADVLLRGGVTPRLLSAVLGVPATNKVLRKLEEARLALWLEAEMRRSYGSRERAKREIFARYASFIYLGNGRYGFAEGSEYYFGKPLSSYGPEGAGQAAPLAAIMKSPRDYAPVPGDSRPLRRRNEILTLMVRNGYIPEDLAKRGQTEPIRVAR